MVPCYVVFFSPLGLTGHNCISAVSHELPAYAKASIEWPFGVEKSYLTSRPVLKSIDFCSMMKGHIRVPSNVPNLLRIHQLKWYSNCKVELNETVKLAKVYYTKLLVCKYTKSSAHMKHTLMTSDSEVPWLWPFRTYMQGDVKHCSIQSMIGNIPNKEQFSGSFYICIPTGMQSWSCPWEDVSCALL